MATRAEVEQAIAEGKILLTGDTTIDDYTTAQLSLLLDLSNGKFVDTDIYDQLSDKLEHDEIKGTYDISAINLSIFDTVLKQLSDNHPIERGDLEINRRALAGETLSEEQEQKLHAKTHFIDSPEDQERFSRFTAASEVAEFMRQFILKQKVNSLSVPQFIAEYKIAARERWALGITDKQILQKMKDLKEEKQFSAEELESTKTALENTGMSEDAINAEIARLGKIKKYDYSNTSRLDSITDEPLTRKDEKGLSRDDKKFLRNATSDDIIKFDSELYAVARRQLLKEHAESVYQNHISKGFEDDDQVAQWEKKLLGMLSHKRADGVDEINLPFMLALAGVTADEYEKMPEKAEPGGKGKNRVQQKAFAKIAGFVEALKELVKEGIPAGINSQLRANRMPYAKDAKTDITQLQTSIREHMGEEQRAKIKALQAEYGIFDSKAVTGTDEKGRQFTLADAIDAFTGIVVEEYATPYFQDIVREKIRKDGVKGERKATELAEVIDKKALKENFGIDVPAKGELQEYYPRNSKPPYRALAENGCKMIKQLANMMHMSFQKTIAVDGFYQGTSQDAYNRAHGYGQRIHERKEDVNGFLDSGIDLSGQKGTPFAELCGKLGIAPTRESLDNFVAAKNINIYDVEDAIASISGLNQEFGAWIKVNGVEAKEKSVAARKQTITEAEAFISGQNSPNAKKAIQNLKAKKMEYADADIRKKNHLAQEIRELEIELLKTSGFPNRWANADKRGFDLNREADKKINGFSSKYQQLFQRLEQEKALPDDQKELSPEDINDIEYDLSFMEDITMAYEQVPISFDMESDFNLDKEAYTKYADWKIKGLKDAYKGKEEKDWSERDKKLLANLKMIETNWDKFVEQGGMPSYCEDSQTGMSMGDEELLDDLDIGPEEPVVDKSADALQIETDIALAFHDFEIGRLEGGKNLFEVKDSDTESNRKTKEIRMKEIGKDIKYLQEMREIYQLLSTGNKERIIVALGLQDMAEEIIDEGLSLSDVLSNVFTQILNHQPGEVETGMAGIANFLYAHKKEQELKNKVWESAASEKIKQAFFNGEKGSFEKLKQAGVFTDENIEIFNRFNSETFREEGMPSFYKGGEKGVVNGKSMPPASRTETRAVESMMMELKDKFLRATPEYLIEIMESISHRTISLAEAQEFKAIAKNLDTNNPVAFADALRKMKEEKEHKKDNEKPGQGEDRKS